MKRFLIYTRTPWAEAPRARHQFAEALSHFHNVVFIEANKIGLPQVKKTIINKNLEVWTPFFPIDYRIRFRTPVINEIYQMWLFNKITSADYIVTFDHTAHLLKNVNTPFLYYCNDDHIKSYGIPLLKTYFKFIENRVIKKAKACFATSDFLYEKLNKRNSNTFKSLLGAPKVSLDYSSLKVRAPKKKIKVVLVGFINKAKYSFHLFKALLEDRNLELHVIGNVHTELSEQLEFYSNYYCHGILKGEKLNTLLRTMDVGIAPYDLEKQDDGGTPNKLWLYLANGLPVVISELKNIKMWEFPAHYVYKIKDNDLFRDSIIQANKEDSTILRRERHTFSQEHTWEQRVKEIMQNLETI